MSTSIHKTRVRFEMKLARLNKPQADITDTQDLKSKLRISYTAAIRMVFT